MGFAGDVAVTTGDLLALLGVTGVPATAFVSADGRVVAIAEGERSPAFLLATIDARLHRPCSTPLHSR